MVSALGEEENAIRRRGTRATHCWSAAAVEHMDGSENIPVLLLIPHTGTQEGDRGLRNTEIQQEHKNTAGTLCLVHDKCFI